LLLLLLAAPCLSAVSARAQGATDMGLAPGADDDDEEVGSDKAEREDPAPMRAAGGDPLGMVRRAEPMGSTGTRTAGRGRPIPHSLPIPTTTLSSARRVATARQAASSTAKNASAGRSETLAAGLAGSTPCWVG
jgi:hypothetical protein